MANKLNIQKSIIPSSLFPTQDAAVYPAGFGFGLSVHDHRRREADPQGAAAEAQDQALQPAEGVVGHHNYRTFLGNLLQALGGDGNKIRLLRDAGLITEQDGKRYDRLRDRIIFVGTVIDDITANLVIAQLLFLEAEDPDRDISIYINSPGGVISSGRASEKSVVMCGCVKAEPKDDGCGRLLTEPSGDTRRASFSSPISARPSKKANTIG